jgi:hypothetical protein
MMRVARPLRHVAVARASARPMSEIPIKTCCRVVSMNVGDEATAIKMDGLVAKLKPVLEAVPGFAGLDRKVCKSEWDYATTMKFDSLDALKGYLGDEATQAKVNELLAEGVDILGGDPAKIHRQNFVHDEM